MIRTDIATARNQDKVKYPHIKSKILLLRIFKKETVVKTELVYDNNE